MRRLEEAGVITGYRAQIDMAKFGLPITAFIRCTSSGPQIGAIAREASEVLEGHRVTGSDESAVGSSGSLLAWSLNTIAQPLPTTDCRLSQET